VSGEALVVGMYRQVEASVETACELLRAGAHFAWAAIHVEWQSYHQRVGLPFAQQAFDLRPVGHSVLGLQNAKLARLSRDGLPDSHTDLPGSIVESEEQAQRAHACPAWEVSRLS